MKKYRSIALVSVVLLTVIGISAFRGFETMTPTYQHIVYFKFKPGITGEQKQQHMDDFAGLQELIPEIKAYSAGHTFKVPYEKTADYDCAHVVGFSSEEDMETYFHHEAHQRFIERNKTFWEKVEVVNYQTGK